MLHNSGGKQPYKTVLSDTDSLMNNAVRNIYIVQTLWLVARWVRPGGQRASLLQFTPIIPGGRMENCSLEGEPEWSGDMVIVKYVTLAYVNLVLNLIWQFKQPW